MDNSIFTYFQDMNDKAARPSFSSLRIGDTITVRLPSQEFVSGKITWLGLYGSLVVEYEVDGNKKWNRFNYYLNVDRETA